MFSFGAKQPATGTTLTATPAAPSFSFGQTAPTTPAVTTTFGGFSSAPPAPTLVQSAGPTISSFSAHPFQYIQQCYDSSSLNYRFRTYFYNTVEGGIVKYPTSKPANISDRLWTQIVNDNPDPNQMVPIVANGFEDLKIRATWQEEQMAAHVEKSKELESRMASLLKKTDLETTSQLQQIQKQQMLLVKRILSIMMNFEVSKRAGHKLQPNEEALKSRLQVLLQKLSEKAPLDPNSIRSTQFQIQALQDVNQLDVLKPVRNLSFDDPAAREGLVKILDEQHKGIKALTETLVQDAKDLEIMRYGFQL